jgi:multidrug efflux system membrane fusion protein
MSRPTKKKLLLSATLLALIAGGALVVQYGPQGMAAAQGAGAEQPPMPVPVMDVAQKPVQLWKEFSGRLVAVDYVEIRPQVSGIIEKVNFEDGQIVQKGDVLFNIDPRPYEAAVANARAEVAAAQEDSEYAQKELKRAEELLKTGAISQAGYDQRINAQKTNKSAINGANARLKAALVDLDHAAIKAPISGRIARPEITEGNLVSATSAPLLTSIVSDKEIYGDFEVDEQTYLSFVRAKAGQDVAAEQAVPVKLSLPNDKKEYQGVIKSFDNRINPSNGTIRARAVFGNEDNALLPGMFAKVRIGSTGKENVITVPEKAVLTDQSRKFVYVVADGAATYREVKLGDSVDGNRIVFSGLQPGDKVIIDNLMKIRPGAKVQAMTPEELQAMKQQMAAQAQGGAAPAGEEKPKEDAPSVTPAGEESATETPTAEPEAIPFEEPSAAADAPADEETPVQE